MSGKIRILSRDGERHPKNGVLSNPGTEIYREWYIEFTDEDTGNVVCLSPKFTELGEEIGMFLSKIIEHEIGNDCNKELDRNPASINHASHFIWYILKPFNNELRKKVIMRAIRSLKKDHFEGEIDKELKDMVRKNE